MTEIHYEYSASCDLEGEMSENLNDIKQSYSGGKVEKFREEREVTWTAGRPSNLAKVTEPSQLYRLYINI